MKGTYYKKPLGRKWCFGCVDSLTEASRIKGGCVTKDGERCYLLAACNKTAKSATKGART